MARQLMRIETENGEAVFVEIDETEAGFGPAGRGGFVEARERFEKGLQEVSEAAQKAMAIFRNAAHRPDDVEIEFGVNFTSEAGAVFAKTGVDAHLTVKLTWSGGTTRTGVAGR